jgi:hypothetical protein
MNSKDIFIAHPNTDEQVNALKAFMNALKIKFEVKNKENYDPDFVKKIFESRQQALMGKTTKVEKENLQEFLGL